MCKTEALYVRVRNIMELRVHELSGQTHPAARIEIRREIEQMKTRLSEIARES